MEKHSQRRAALALGLAAAVMTALTAAYYVRAGSAQALILRPAGAEELPAGRTALIDLNTAGAEELEALPGIGPALAGRVVERRESDGPFETKEDILAVSGVGEGIYEEIEPYITY